MSGEWRDRRCHLFCRWITILLVMAMAAPGLAATTQIQIVRYANDGSTVLNQTTVDYPWMMANLPVLGDGVTHYYHQGPVFADNPDDATEQLIRWNTTENTNCYPEKDMGAVMGTNLKDLCDLVGGMNAGEELKILASDGWYKWFAYENVYQHSSREGPIVICWYQNGKYPDSGYADGMRMVWFADTSVNPWGKHVFGNWDWHQAADEKYWYYYQSGSEMYPTTTGLSGMYVNRIYIFSNEDPSSGVMPIPGYSDPPTDPDGDGLYEDLNANGRKDFADVVLFFNSMEWIEVSEPRAAFDFNGNTRIDFNDIVLLFEEI